MSQHSEAIDGMQQAPTSPAALARESATPSEVSQQDNEYRLLLDSLANAKQAPLPTPKLEGRSKKSIGLIPRKWLKCDIQGNISMVKVEKHALVHNLGLQARDLRLLEPQVSGTYPSAILTREKALVVTMESIKTICTPDYVLVFNPEDRTVMPFVEQLIKALRPAAPPAPPVQLSKSERKLRGSLSAPNLHAPHLHTLERDSTHSVGSVGGDSNMSGLLLLHQTQAPPTITHHTGPGSESDGELPSLEQAVVKGTDMEVDDSTPFELKALEVVLDYVSLRMEQEAGELEIAAHPALDALTKHINSINLERVRRIKNKLARLLNNKVEKLKEILEGLLDDDSDLRDMNLTARRERERLEKEREMAMERVLSGDAIEQEIAKQVPSLQGRKTPVDLLGLQLGGKDSDEFIDDTEDNTVEEVEMVLEPYFMRLDNTYNKLRSLTEYIDDTEDFINISLDSKRNQLIKIDLILTCFTFTMTVVAAVSALFGMNLRNAELLGDPGSYWGFCTVSGILSLFVVAFMVLFLIYVRYKKILIY